MTNRGIDIKHPKERGEWAELRFMARAAEFGLRVSKPFGESAHYDVTVEHDGQFLRVQVKSTASQKHNSYGCALHGNRTLYQAGDFDFLAAYIIPLDVWFILPFEIAIRGQQKLYLTPHYPQSIYEPYREAWHLLTGKKPKKTRVGTAAQACPERSRRGCPAEQSPAESTAPPEPFSEPGEEDCSEPREEARLQPKEKHDDHDDDEAGDNTTTSDAAPPSLIESRLRAIQSRLFSSPQWKPRR
jgi:PD-(D/E)XK endonuclease